MSKLKDSAVIKSGLKLREKHRFKQAQDLFQKLASDSSNPIIWYYLAVTLDNRGKEPEAIPAYNKALQLGLSGKYKANAYAWLGSSLRKTGNPRKALVCFRKAKQFGYRDKNQLERFETLAKIAIGK